jgi:hypothetical protein
MSALHLALDPAEGLVVDRLFVALSLRRDK